MEMNLNQVYVNRIIDAALNIIPKNLNLKVSEWAEQNRVLPLKASATPGPFSFDKVPHLREIADQFSKSCSTREIAVMKSVQACVTTTVYENFLGYKIDCDPAQMMFASADLKLLKEFKNERISPMIDNSGLRQKIITETDDKKSRKFGETAEKINFIGGSLRLVGSHNANAFRTFSVEGLLIDEVEGFPEKVNGGDPIKLLTARTNAFPNTKKIGYISTPGLKHNGRIHKLFEIGDQRRYQVSCPFCGCFQELIFYDANGGEYPDEKGIIKDGVLQKPYGLVFNSEECKRGDFSSVAYKCKHCGELIPEHYKPEMLAKGYWKSTAQSKKPYFVSYYVSGFLSPTFSWWNIVYDFLEAGNDPIKLQTFYNNDLGLPFEDTSSGVDAVSINKLRDGLYKNNECPHEAYFLTAACDVQDDRLEVEIKAWGDRFRNWGIDHRVIYGNTSDSMDPCWQELAKIKDEIWGGKQIYYMLIDSGDGDKTDLIYRFCENYGEGVIYPLKGVGLTASSRDKFKIQKIENYSVPLITITVDLYKNQLARWFNQEWRYGENYPDGWTTVANGYSDEYLRQLTTEKRIKRKLDSGLIVITWEAHGRNEAFDLNVYNLCAAEIVINELSKNNLQLPVSNASAVFEMFKGAA